MQGGQIQDRIAQGMGTAARAIGVVCNAYRPVALQDPLASGNRFLQLNAAFTPQDSQFRRAGLPGNPVWYGVFDSAYLQPGDYLVETTSSRIWLVGEIQPLLPALCVLTNGVVTVTRPQGYQQAGLSAYGGGTTSAPLLAGFPASLLHAAGMHGMVPVPADARISGAVILLPQILGFSPERGDQVTDSLGRAFIVGQVEPNALGWRLDVRQAEL